MKFKTLISKHWFIWVIVGMFIVLVCLVGYISIVSPNDDSRASIISLLPRPHPVPPPVQNSNSQVGANTPKITTLTPASGPAGTQVTITGEGFAKANNFITFGHSKGSHHLDGSADNVIAKADSADQKTLTFTVPGSGPSGILCDNTQHCIAVAAIRLAPGNYPVEVCDRIGTDTFCSTALVFALK